jgi:uncharacterized iron-regulated membrane protein
MSQNVVSLRKAAAVAPDAPPADPAELARGSELQDQQRPRLFRAVWRWHFYAGLLVIPIVVMLSLTGIVYLFKPQIDSVFLGHLRNIDDPGRPTLSYAKQMATATAAVPGATVSSLSPPPNGRRSTMFGLTTKSGRAWTVYVDPYTGKVLGHTDDQHQITKIARDIHGSLLTNRFWASPGPFGPQGVWGDRLIELAACWALVLVLTGMYLWWPRGARRSFRAALRPRLRARSPRVRWRDVHAVTGVAFSFVFLFFIVSGLFWTGTWGTKYQDVATKIGASYPAAVTDGVPSRTLAQVGGRDKASWAGGELPVPPSAYAAGQAPAAGQAAGLRWNPKAGAPIDAIVARAQQMRIAPGYSIAFPADKTGSYAVSRYPDIDVQPNQNALKERYAFIDQYTAGPVGDVPFSRFGPMAQATDLAISLHQGRQFGLANQLLMLLGTLALLLSCATAIVMWRKRRPKGIGAPRRAPDRRLGARVVAITLGLGVFFPLLGISILALLLFDFGIVKHVPPLRRALGAY